MFQVQKFDSMAYMLENVVFFCVGDVPLEIERRQKDRGDVTVVNLPAFVGRTQNKFDIHAFLDRTGIDWIENEARMSKKVSIVVAPNFTTLKVAYALMRDWCVANAVEDLREINKSFGTDGLLPLIPNPSRPRR